MEYHENEWFCDQDLREGETAEIEFSACTFQDCTVEAHRFTACKWIDCNFINCRIENPKLERSSMMDCSFEKCSLMGISWGTLLGGGYLIPLSSLRDCQLRYNHFLEIDFARFDFSANTIVDSMFADCDLSGSSFAQCRLDRTEFFRCDLRKADFRGAHGYEIDLTANTLKQARFSFPEVVELLRGTGILIE